MNLFCHFVVQPSAFLAQRHAFDITQLKSRDGAVIPRPVDIQCNTYVRCCCILRRNPTLSKLSLALHCSPNGDIIGWLRVDTASHPLSRPSFAVRRHAAGAAVLLREPIPRDPRSFLATAGWCGPPASLIGQFQRRTGAVGEGCPSSPAARPRQRLHRVHVQAEGQQAQPGRPRRRPLCCPAAGGSTSRQRRSRRAQLIFFSMM